MDTPASPATGRNASRPAAGSAAAGRDERRTSGETAPPRSAYQQRLDQVKVRIVELSHRNMENALRIMRRWLNEK